jgi:hypothetical protein
MIDVNPCLFISDKVIFLVYVDDTLLYARDMKDIDDVIRRLTDEHKMTLEVEDDVARFLGVHIDCNKETGEVTLTVGGCYSSMRMMINIGRMSVWGRDR